jgi:Tol biopolymer transport system component
MFVNQALSRRQILLFLPFFFLLLDVGCKKSVTGPDNTPRGNFVQKIVYTTFKFNAPPYLNVADLYEDNGVFRLFNNTKLVDDGSTANLAPDGSWLVYMYVSQWPRLMIMNIDGKDQREIVLSQSDSFIQDGDISFDGKSIAVVYQKFYQFDGLHVGVMGINGENFHPVFVDSSQCGPVTWSPDGKVFFQWYDANNRFGHNPPQTFLARSYICSVNADGTGWRVVSDTISGLSNDKGPCVSPDGKLIVLISPRAYFPQYLLEDIYLMNIDGTNVRRLTQVTFSRNGNHFDFYTNYDAPHWLEDSKHIIFQYEIWTYDPSQGLPVPSEDLYVMDVDGTGMQRLTYDGTSELLKESSRR